MAAEKIRVQLKWIHQAQFAGFYVAMDKGYYAKEDLDVVLIPNNGKTDLVSAITSGVADVAVLSPEDIIIRRNQGIPIKAIAAIYRRSAVVYLSMPGSGILRPQDFVGKTIASAGQQGSVRDFEFQLDAMIKTLGMDMALIRNVPYDPEYKGFYNGSVDVTAAYATGGLIKVRQKGYAPNIIWPGDYKVRFYSDTLATTDQMVDRQSEKLFRFLRASLKGWQTAVGDPTGTIETIMKYAQTKDRKIQTAMFEAMLPLVHTGEDMIGWMRPKDWHDMHQMLAEQGLIDNPKDQVNQLFTMQFLDRIKQEGLR
ncbi:ABC transporter substrate-binding protein [Desulfosarcina cetonica]